jgi:hypothetical protein
MSHWLILFSIRVNLFILMKSPVEIKVKKKIQITDEQLYPVISQDLEDLTAYTSESPEFTSVFSGVRVTRSLVLCVFCRSLFILFLLAIVLSVLLSFFFWPLCCLSFDLRILITPLVSSNSSSYIFLIHWLTFVRFPYIVRISNFNPLLWNHRDNMDQICLR